MSITIITKRSDYPKYDFAILNFAFANFIFYQIGSISNDVMKVMWKSNEMWNSIMDDVNNFKFVNMHSDWYFSANMFPGYFSVWLKRFYSSHSEFPLKSIYLNAPQIIDNLFMMKYCEFQDIFNGEVLRILRKVAILPTFPSSSKIGN